MVVVVAFDVGVGVAVSVIFLGVAVELDVGEAGVARKGSCFSLVIASGDFVPTMKMMALIASAATNANASCGISFFFARRS